LIAPSFSLGITSRCSGVFRDSLGLAADKFGQQKRALAFISFYASKLYGEAGVNVF
jgi:hypothetical protein